MSHVFPALAAAALLSGCQCRADPSIPTPPEPSPPPVLPTADTGPVPACELEESEPNNAVVDADELWLEADACGEFQVTADGDRWRFVLDRDAWVSLDVEARENGSLANPQLVLSGEGLVLDRLDGDETADAHLHVPLVAGVYDVLVRDQDGSGDGDGRWFYDLQVSEQKAPTAWDAGETEPNQVGSANPLPLDTRVFGLLDGDDDVFAVTLPEGRRTLTVQVWGFALGSPADTTLLLEDTAGNALVCVDNPTCTFPRGLVGFESDPVASILSEGDETLQVRVRNEVPSQTSSAHWYVIEATAP